MTTSRLHAGGVALLASLALVAVAASPALATAPATPQAAAFALSPVGSSGAIVMHGNRGRVLHGAVLVRSLSAQPVTVVLQSADIQNASNGNAAYVTTRLSQAGRWLRLAAGRISLAPHSSRQITFTVSVPAGTTGASHYAGIVAINAADLASVSQPGTRRRHAFTFYRIERQALPVTIRLPGPLWRHLVLNSASISIAPVGAGLVLGLLPGGTELIEGAQVKLRVQRGGRTVFSYAATIGQLFPAAPLKYRIPWQGRPRPGSYQVQGVIRPQGAPPIYINQTVAFTSASFNRLSAVVPPAGQGSPGSPTWMWIVLGAAAAMLLTLSATVWRLLRRSIKTGAHAQGT